jgi:hypothetical protein
VKNVKLCNGKERLDNSRTEKFFLESQFFLVEQQIKTTSKNRKSQLEAAFFCVGDRLGKKFGSSAPKHAEKWQICVAATKQGKPCRKQKQL